MTPHALGLRGPADPTLLERADRTIRLVDGRITELTG